MARQVKKAEFKAFKGGVVKSGNWYWAVTHQGCLVGDEHVRPTVLISVNHSVCYAYGFDPEQVAEIIAEALDAAQESGRLKRPMPL